MCSMSSKICKECGHSCHCRDVCTVRTDEDSPGQTIIAMCECNDCRCEKDNEIPYISGLISQIVIKRGTK